MGSKWILRRLAGGCGVDSPGSGQGPLAGCCECGDEHSGCGATELFSWLVSFTFVTPSGCAASCLPSVNTPVSVAASDPLPCPDHVLPTSMVRCHEHTGCV
jgi:hypothetical protein